MLLEATLQLCFSPLKGATYEGQSLQVRQGLASINAGHLLVKYELHHLRDLCSDKKDGEQRNRYG